MDSLKRLLKSLQKQTFPLSEIIIVDGSEATGDKSQVEDWCKGVPVTHLFSASSVCLQRNIGIQAAKSDWIFLCDDDVQLPQTYVQSVMDYVSRNSKVGAASGYFMEKNDIGEWQYAYPTPSAWSLLWHFIFQWPLWCELDQWQARNFNKMFVQPILEFYRKRGNSLSLAGWPINTRFSGDAIEVTVYSLGAAIVRRQWLLEFTFDEVLDQFGIGDNYGVTINFPNPLHIVADARAYHHRIPDNRIPEELSYFRRVISLGYFLVTSGHFNRIHLFFFVWSLIGNWIAQIKNGEWRKARATRKALQLIVTGRNPYSLARKTGPKTQINPVF